MQPKPRGITSKLYIMANISLYLDTRTRSKSGLYRVKIAVRNGQSAFFIPTNVKIKPEQWQGGMIIGTKMDRQLNKVLETKLGMLRMKLVQVSAVTDIGGLTARELAALLDDGVKPLEEEQAARDLFVPFFKKFIAGKAKDTTRGVYALTLRKVERFCQGVGIDAEALRFKGVNYKWLCDFERWMVAEGNAVNTRSINMRNVRAVFNEAIKLGVVGLEAYPFRVFRIRSEETAKRSLRVEELRRLRDFPCEAHLQKWVDLFFLSFYLAGINMVDLLSLPPMNRGERLVYRRSKTNVLCDMAVPPEAWALIDKYRGQERLLSFGERYADRKDLLHRMNEGLQQVGDVSYGEMRASNNAVHRVKRRTPLFPQLTSYWARHTWATLAADLDIPDAVIDAALGHKSPYRMTEIYVRRNARKVDAAVRRVIDYVSGDAVGLE